MTDKTMTCPRCLKTLRHGVHTCTPTQYVGELEQEVERLRQICRNAYEVWVGSEGISVTETAPEAYLLHLIEQMRDEVKKGLVSDES